jgi:hypothetical protein
MPKLVLRGFLLLHGMIGNRIWNPFVGVIAQLSMGSVGTLLIVTFAIALVQKASAQETR